MIEKENLGKKKKYKEYSLFMKKAIFDKGNFILKNFFSSSFLNSISFKSL